MRWLLHRFNCKPLGLIPPKRPWRNSLVLLLLFVLRTAGVKAQPWASLDAEYQLKAVFIFNFAQYVEWPPEAFSSDNSPIRIGVLGTNYFKNKLEETVHGETVRNRHFEVMFYQRVDEIKECHILFISRSENARLGTILPSLKKRNILTIGESDDFGSKGGIIQFVVRGNKIRFRIQRQAAKEANLNLSSKLVRLALNADEPPN